MYTIIDIETTGGTARSHRIIEIAIVTYADGQVVDRYATLINPMKFVPAFISSLTGITNEMVEHAPTFEEVAETILSKTEGQIFVAHNVNFDFSFLKQEFNILGIKFERKKLCTVRLAKKIVPGLRSYGLGALTSELGIEITNRHRALGDAEATALMLDHLIRNDQDDFIGFSLHKKSKEATLPPHLPKEVFESLPEKTGVYYLHNEKGKVVYVGKARKIKSRILGHFTSESGMSKRMFHENIHHISYELTGNELIALLLESREIKRLWPEYNRAQKLALSNHSLYHYCDRSGYLHFTISKTQIGARPLASFRNFQEGRTFVNELVRKFKLCPKLCGLQKSNGACFDHSIGLCDGACKGDISVDYYNHRMSLAMQSIGEEKRSFAIVGHGRSVDERTLVLVQNGCYLGHGFTDFNIPSHSFEELKDRIRQYPDNQDIQNS
ncbi:MAG: GIY-YIG nuclease family protein [Cyclobacteriaceae bacterium]|nr:GIY-YIG nuclease family protein [Cyclobacteriaceae bacterium]